MHSDPGFPAKVPGWAPFTQVRTPRCSNTRWAFAASPCHRHLADAPKPRMSRHDHPRRPGAGEPHMGRPAGARPAELPAGAPGGRAGGRGDPAAPARGSTKREDKDSLTVGSHAAVRRLARRREAKDSPEFLIFPHSTTPPRRLPRLRRPRRAAPCPPSRRSSIRRPNAQPKGRGWPRAAIGAWYVCPVKDRRLGASASRAQRGTANRYASRVFVVTFRPWSLHASYRRNSRTE